MHAAEKQQVGEDTKSDQWKERNSYASCEGELVGDLMSREIKEKKWEG